MEQIIDSLAWAERVVVVAEALMARLPGRPSLAARLLDACLQPAAASPQPSAAAFSREPHEAGRDAGDGRHAAESQVWREERDQGAGSEAGHPADGKGCSSLRGDEELAAGVRVMDVRDRALLVALMQRQPVSVGDEPESTSSQQESASEASSRAAPPRRRSSSVGEAGTEDWAAPLQTVRLLQCDFGAGNGRAAPAVNNGDASASGSRHEHVHQLYARVRPGELRIATVVLMES